MIITAKDLISKYGQTITVKADTNSTPVQTKAFIQPLRWDGQSALYGDYVETQGTEQFLYIGMPNFALINYPTTTILTASNQNYIIKKAESVYLSDKIIYERAVLEKEPNQ